MAAQPFIGRTGAASCHEHPIALKQENEPLGIHPRERNMQMTRQAMLHITRDNCRRDVLAQSLLHAITQTLKALRLGFAMCLGKLQRRCKADRTSHILRPAAQATLLPATNDEWIKPHLAG